jgi:aspartate carbamoyltransferase catalytic subunit
MGRKLARLLTEKELDKELLTELFDLASTLEHTRDNRLAGKVLCSYTDEESTRTMTSTQMAMLRLGGQYIHLPSAGSSEGKDETFEDTAVTLATIGADVLALRRRDEESIFAAAARIAQLCPTPIINCGGGGMYHPTQAASDLYTIKRVRGTIDGLKIAFVGGLNNSRTVNSLAYLLTQWPGVEMYLVAPDHLQLKASLRLYLNDHRIVFRETTSLESVLAIADVFYQSRIQWNHDANPEVARLQKPPYVFNHENVSRMKEKAFILHPWPRNQELAREVDLMPQQQYIKLMHYATLMRMAILSNMLA